jgi:putative oxidoreductase
MNPIAVNTWINRWLTVKRVSDTVLNALQPLASMAARIYVARVFFSSGLTKLNDWETTLALFEYEYAVPVLPPEVAAWMGTAGEICLPVLLVLGLGGRFPALGLTVVNLVAVVSLMEVAPEALQQHISWGIVLAALTLFGSGSWSLDHWMARRFERKE